VPERADIVLTGSQCDNVAPFLISLWVALLSSTMWMLCRQCLRCGIRHIILSIALSVSRTPNHHASCDLLTAEVLSFQHKCMWIVLH